MPIRKNTKRIDPRYFLHEKTEVLKESLVDAIIQIIKDSPSDDMDDTDLHTAVKEKFPRLSDMQIDQAMNDPKLNSYYDSLEGVYSKNSVTEELNEMDIPDLGAVEGQYRAAKSMFYSNLRKILEEFVTESGGKFDKAMALRIQRGAARVLGDRK